MNDVTKLPPLPTLFDESWRKSDVEGFFLPESEMLTFAGTPLGQTVQMGWKVQLRTVSKADLRAKLEEKFTATGADLSALVADDSLAYTAFFDVGHGVVEAFVSESLRSTLDISSQKAKIAPVSDDSEVSRALAERLQVLCPHALTLQIKSMGSEIPRIVVANQFDATFSQNFANLDVSIEGSAELMIAEGQSANTSFAHRRHRINVTKNACVTSSWLHLGHKENDEGRMLLERRVEVAEGGQFVDAQLFVPTTHVRVNSNVFMAGRGKAESGAAVLASGHGFLDYEPLQQHRGPGARSDFELMTVVTDRARLQFQGLIIVEREAPGSAATQENRNLVLSKRARVDAAPRLHILPQDVSCKHGSASGEIDSNQLYYLNSRGFDTAAAKRLILQGFVWKGLSHLDSEHAFSKMLEGIVDKSLSAFV